MSKCKKRRPADKEQDEPMCWCDSCGRKLYECDYVYHSSSGTYCENCISFVWDNE